NGVSHCHPGWSAVARSQLTATSASQVQLIVPLSASQVSGTAGKHHQTQLIFVFFVEINFCIFHRVCQTGLELLTTSDPATSASQKGWDYRHEPLHLAQSRAFFSSLCYVVFHCHRLGRNPSRNMLCWIE
uniref:Uncharacterized protein n=1 Tax=Macaca fascicularis TaxID=9541 RepID=A0A7N9D1C9_MACFA